MSKKEKLLKCLIIYENGSFEVKKIKEELKSFYETIGCELIDIHSVGDQICMMFDDEGKFDEKKVGNPVFQPYQPHDTVVGTIILFKEDGEGGFKDLTSEDVTKIRNYIYLRLNKHNMI